MGMKFSGFIQVSRSGAISLILCSFATLNVQAYQVGSLTECKAPWGPSAWARSLMCDENETDWFFESTSLRQLYRKSEKLLKSDAILNTSIFEKPDPTDSAEEQNDYRLSSIVQVLLGYALVGDHAGVNSTAVKIKNELCPIEYFKNAFEKAFCENIGQIALHPTDFIEDIQCQSLYIVKENIQRTTIVHVSSFKKAEKLAKSHPPSSEELVSKYRGACPLRKPVREDKDNPHTDAGSEGSRKHQSSSAK